jgi:very-short-patch-repair endonuclease
MLNYRPSVRLGLSVQGESSQSVHTLLVEQGRKMSFVGKPDKPRQPSLSGTIHDHGDAIALSAHRQAAEEELDAFIGNAAVPVDQMDTKLNVDESESMVQIKLRTLYREGQLANEELGINTLFLTLGTLEWSETSERSFRAPLLYVPVQLERQQNGSMRLRHDGSDVGENLPLRAKLQEFNLKLPEFTDEKSLSVYFDEVESALRSREDWNVHRDEICLGFFNYEKYAMYVDLSGDQWPIDKKPWNNLDLMAMLGGTYSAAESPISEASFLDEVRPVQQCREVYDADSSQLLAMIRAAEGLSIVVEGPPGTGKSQTITNIIAEAVAANKTVLFVSAKRAALDVVKRRLKEADLGDMCLDLHDKLTNRREFYSEIKRTADKNLQIRNEEEKVARLTELREKLNLHATAVNTPLEEFGISPFTAMSRLGALPKETPEDRDGRIPFDALRAKEPEFRSHLPSIKSLQEKLKVTGVPANHPFWGSGLDAIDPGLRLDIEEDLRRAIAAIEAAVEALNQAALALCIDHPRLVRDASLLPRCLEQALSAPPLEGVPVNTSAWLNAESVIRQGIGQVRRYRELTQARSAQLAESAWNADLSATKEIYDQWAPRWYRFVSGDFRSARNKLAPLLKSPVAIPEQRLILHDILERQSLERDIDNNKEGSRLFGVQWRGVSSDPELLEGLLGWILDLHRSIGSNQLPAGLLNLFSGDIDQEQLKAVVDEGNKKSLEAIAAYKLLLAHLRSTIGASQVVNGTWEDLQAICERWQANLHRLTEWVALTEARNLLIARGLQPVVEVADRWSKAGESLTASFLRSYYSGVLRQAIEERPELKNFDRDEHEASIEEFRSLDDFKLRYNRAQVRLAHVKNMPGLTDAVTGGNLHLLRLQTELKTRHKPIRWIMQRAGEAIQRIKPVFMMSPLSVAIHLPPELPPFDLVIFDEASQVRPEDAMSAIIRAKQSIVVGDTRQMPPTSFFDRVADNEEYDEDADEVTQEIAKLESVLSLMSAAVNSKTRRPDLRWHYRSIHPGLIQPSNEMFYGNRLIIFPSSGEHAHGRRIGVVFHHDPTSVYEPGSRKRINQKEADQVAATVLRHVRETPELSLMVAAMNKPQADLIYDKVQLLERQYSDVFADFHAKHPHEPLDIKNLENVQGDERDVVYISFTYGRDEGGIIRQQFGPLLRDGGERRLNVLITRARQRCEVFSNLRSDDLRVDSPKPGLLAIKSYLKFAEFGDMDLSVPTGQAEESPFEEEVSRALVEHGYEVATQVGCAEFRIDLAVRDQRAPGSFVLGIECDGATYHSARSARDRDKLRQRVLEDRGWTIHRIWSHDWWQDRDAEIKRLISRIEAAVQQSDAADATTSPAGAESSSAVETFIEVSGARPVPRGTRAYTTAPPQIAADERSLLASLFEIVRAEAPIHHELLLLRLRDAAGFGRTGKQLRDYYENLIAKCLALGMIQKVDDAYYLKPEDLEVPRDWTDRPSAERKIGYLPSVEVEAAILYVVSGSFGIAPEPAIRAAYGLLGFKRVSEEALDKGIQAISRLDQRQSLRTVSGTLQRI